MGVVQTEPPLTVVTSRTAADKIPALHWPPPCSLYVHIPFCPYKCTYCDFVTHVGSHKLVQPYIDAVCREIDQLEHWAGVRELRTVFLGGGTPGMLSPAQIHQILASADRSLGIVDGGEISLEANPDAVDGAKLAGFRAAGVNRLSFGVQSFDRDELKVLGRGHSPEQVSEVMALARGAGFDNISLDLIYGSPGQTRDSWRRTLDSAMNLQPDHVSMYSLIVEPGTAFGRLKKLGRLRVPDDDKVADMYDMGCEVMRDHRFVHYEVANWSHPGRDCRHNLAYWHNEQFFAVGVGAHDYLVPYRSARLRTVRHYIEAVRRGDSVIERREHVGPEDERFETAIMGLRLLQEGLSRRAYRARFAEDFDHRYGSVVRELVDLGFVDDDGDAVRLRESMVVLANEAWERFLPA
jgi:oxygen-independent coproporphyrinogen III oxidase